MVKSGLGNDNILINKLWFIFDEKSAGKVDFKEILAGIEVFRSLKPKTLLHELLGIVDIEETGYANYQGVSQVFQALCFKFEEKTRIKGLSRLEFKSKFAT